MFMMNLFILDTPSEISAELGRRLKARRIHLQLTQKEVAQRTDLSLPTIVKLESTGQGSIDNLIRVVCTLGLVSDLEKLFQFEVLSIADLVEMERRQKQQPKRVSRKRSKPL